MLARFTSDPPGGLIPARLLTELTALEARDVLVTPVDTADACSATTMVSTSSTWLARTSRAASAKREPACQIEPGEAGTATAERASDSATYRLSGLLPAVVSFFFFAHIGAAPHMATTSATARVDLMVDAPCPVGRRRPLAARDLQLLCPAPGRARE